MGNQPSFCARHFVAFVASAVFLLLPTSASAADLVLSPDTGTFAAETEFSVKILVDPKGEAVNASDGKLTFTSDTLSVASISKDGSTFSLWTAEPKFSNSAGTLEYSGGTPTSFKSNGTILTIKFKGKKEGEAKITVTEGTVLAADGKGTNVFKTGGTATFTIGPAAPAAESEPEVEGGGDGVTPVAPVVNSTTHAKPENWYATTTAVFSWKPTADVTAIRSLFSDKDDALPASLVDQKLATSQRVIATADGTWYFYVQYKNDFGWGEVTKRIVQIDTVPPKEFEVSLKAEGDNEKIPKIAFLAEDALSGVDRYEMIFASTSVATIKAADLINGMTIVPPQEGGQTLVTIKAFDKAGNIRTAQKDIMLPKVNKPKTAEEEAAIPQNTSIWTIERILTILFALMIGGLATSNYFAKKRADEEKNRLLAAVLEVRDKNDKVFGAMREEFEQMVNDFDEKPQLTAEERDFLENIKEVLDISEELIDTSIDELKKKVRGQ